jgi:hypothetical protein
MRRSSLGLFLATAAAAYAQAPGKPASVEGMVTHALTGAPIQRVHVTLDGFNGFRQQQYGASTDAEGKFSIAGVPPGNYALGAERPGFVPLTDNRSMSLAIKAGDTKTDLKLTLTPTGGLVGRVLDADQRGGRRNGAGRRTHPPD